MSGVDGPVHAGPRRGGGRLPILQVQLCVGVDEDRTRAVTAAQHWFKDGFTQLGGPFYEAATRCTPTELHIDTRLSNRVPNAVSVMLSSGRFQTSYSPVMFDALLQSLADVPDGAILACQSNGDDGDVGMGPILDLHAWRIDTDAGAWLHLRFLTVRTPLVRGGGMAPLLAFLRGVANLANPVHGEIFWGNQFLEGVFERATHMNPTQTLPRARQFLRGYAWLTILPEEIGHRLGGLDALRSSGAFVEVEHLDAGGYWCRATSTIDEYDQAAAERVFDIVAPVLPPGRPFIAGIAPNALSPRDASHR